jgi:hypothetical protein
MSQPATRSPPYSHRTPFSCTGFNSYIIGTITLVVMKGDERTGYYRQRANNLKQYSKVNNVPQVD